MRFTQVCESFVQQLSSRPNNPTFPQPTSDGFSWFENGLNIRFETSLPPGNNRFQYEAYSDIKRAKFTIREDLKAILVASNIRPRKFYAIPPAGPNVAFIRLVHKYVEVLSNHLIVQAEYQQIQESKMARTLERRMAQKAQAPLRQEALNKFMGSLVNYVDPTIVGVADDVVNVKINDNMTIRAELGPNIVKLTDIFIEKEMTPDKAATVVASMLGLSL